MSGKKVVHNLIRNAVYQNTAAEGPPSSESVKSLLRYLTDPETVDAVYERIIDRVNTDKTRNEMSLRRAVQLLKSNLTSFVPSNDTLGKLDKFCQSVVTDNESILKSISFVRTLILKIMKKGLERTGASTLDTKEGKSVALGTSPNKEREKDRDREKEKERDFPEVAHHIGSPTKASSSYLVAVTAMSPTPSLTSSPNSFSPTVTSPAPSSPVLSTGENKSRPSSAGQIVAGPMLISDFLFQRQPPKHFPKKASAVSLLLSPLFGGQFRKSTSNGVKALDSNEITHFPDDGIYADPIRTVCNTKKVEETQKYRDQMQLTLRRKTPMLFHYKYYSEQLPLNLTNEEMDQVISTAIHPPSTADGIQLESRLIASKILIKLFLDIYSREGPGKSPVILAVMFDMLGCSTLPDTRIHAFNLLFNLSVHVNMFQEIKLEDPEPEHSLTMVDRIQEDLFGFLLEMLLYILHKRERDERVWYAALVCMVFFITDRGCVIREKLLMVDSRVLVAFFTHVDWYSVAGPVDLYRHLVRMLANTLYSVTFTLDVSKLDRLGGIATIIDIYVTAHSQEARNNLFTILFDYAVYQLAARKPFDHKEPQVAMLLEILKRFDAAQYLPQVFKFLPEKFAEDFVRSVFFEQLKRDSALSPVASKMDKRFVMKVLHEIEKLARDYQKVHPEFDIRHQQMLASSTVNTEHFKILDQLLHSDVAAHRTHGEAWLFGLMRVAYEKHGPLANAVQDEVDATFMKLLTSPNPLVRRTYLSLVEKLILLVKSKMPTHGDESGLRVIFFVMNVCLGRLVTVAEKNEGNILFTLDILLDLVTVRIATDSGGIREADSLYGSLLRNQSVVSRTLLKNLDGMLLHHLFINLPSRHADARLILLHLLIDMCKAKSTLLAGIGGIAFYKTLLLDQEPRIAYHASHFLISQFEAERPEEYRIMITQLLNKARETNNENLVSNPYFQIRGIIELNALSAPKS